MSTAPSLYILDDMVDYISVEIECLTSEGGEVAAALLSEIGFEGFEELPGKLLCYVPASVYSEELVSEICGSLNMRFRIVEVPGQNWNALWESNFEPVVVEGFCTIVAHFHDVEVVTPYKLLITPKMSFGTGHHDTTRLMVGFMRDLDFVGKRVFDFGTGTGILAILAEKLGAVEVFGIDNEEWAVENALENAANNGCNSVSVELMDDPARVAERVFDMVLANINRNVLTRFMPVLRKLVADTGTLVLSGLLLADFDAVEAAAMKEGLVLVERRDAGNWTAMRLGVSAVGV